LAFLPALFPSFAHLLQIVANNRKTKPDQRDILRKLPPNFAQDRKEAQLTYPQLPILRKTQTAKRYLS
jgi:hypothetical protein